MPTARELLEQADALMRRNRGGDSGIPLLTDAVPEESAIPSRTGLSTRERGPTSRGQTADARAPRDWALRDDANRAPESSGVDEVTDAAVTPLGGEPAAPPVSAVPAEDIDVLGKTDDSDGDLEPPLLTDVVEEAASKNFSIILKSDGKDRTAGIGVEQIRCACCRVEPSNSVARLSNNGGKRAAN